MADSPPPRNRAFVSYSHADAEHLTRLHVHLAPYTREHKVDVWDDTRITPGARWKEEIKQAMASAKVAILLVSADFMASEFIAHDELPPLLEAAEQQGTLILSVILSPCSFEWSKLARYQALNAPSDPLIDMPRGKQEAIWSRLAKYVADALRPVPSDSMPQQPTPAISTPAEEFKGPEPAPKDDAPTRQQAFIPPLPSAETPQPQPISSSIAVLNKPTLAPPGTTLLTYQGHSTVVRSLVCEIWAVAWSPDSTRIVSSSSDGTVQVWDSTTGNHILTYVHSAGGDAKTVYHVAWSPDGTRIASSDGEAAQVWDATTGQLLLYKDLARTVNPIAWSPDGSRIASSSILDGEHYPVQAWDAKTGKRLLTHNDYQSGRVVAVAWSPDGTRIASCHRDYNTVYVWDATTDKNLLFYKGHSSDVHALAWSPDGKRIASAGDGIQVWNATTGDHLLTHVHKASLIAWSPDGKRIASAGNGIQVWDAITGDHYFTYMGHSNSSSIHALAWSPDGTRIASASRTMQVWSAG